MLRITTLLLAAACLFTIGSELQAQDADAKKSDLHPVAQDVKKMLGKHQGPFTLMVTLTAQEGQAQKLIKAYQPAAKATREEEGNVQYLLNQSLDNPQQFILFERWKSLQALDAHLKQPYLTKLLEEFDGVLAGPPELKVMKFQLAGRQNGKKQSAK